MSEADHEKGIMLFIIVSLIVGGVLREVSKRLGIPYSPMLLVVGIFWGYFDDQIGFLGTSAKIVSGMEPVSFI